MPWSLQSQMCIFLKTWKHMYVSQLCFSLSKWTGFNWVFKICKTRRQVSVKSGCSGKATQYYSWVQFKQLQKKDLGIIRGLWGGVSNQWSLSALGHNTASTLPGLPSPAQWACNSGGRGHREVIHDGSTNILESSFIVLPWHMHAWKSLSHTWVFATPYSPRNSPGKNAGVGCLALLQGIFLTHELNLGLPHCGQFLYQLSHMGNRPPPPKYRPSGLRHDIP